MSPEKAAIPAETDAVKFSFVFAIALLAADSACATDAEIPLPRPKPSEMQAIPAFETDPQTGAPVVPQPSACQARLVADHVAVIEVLPSIIGPNECGATDVVRLDSVILPDRTPVAVLPQPILRCEMAEAVAHWVREDVAPAMPTVGGELRALDNFDSYDCRGRNRIFGAKVSEHGRANALDVRGMRLASGKFIDLTDRALSRGFRENIRASVCRRFSTVLGPGSDGYHETHIHLDLAERRGDYKLCQWAVLDLEIPLPRPRPQEAPVAAENEKSEGSP